VRSEHAAGTIHVSGLVQNDVPMKKRDVSDDGLEGDDAAPRPDEARPEKRVVPDVGPDVEKDVSRPQGSHKARRLLPISRR
jgi:hypothetical protein